MYFLSVKKFIYWRRLFIAISNQKLNLQTLMWPLLELVIVLYSEMLNEI